jgi:hypothetical protein
MDEMTDHMRSLLSDIVIAAWEANAITDDQHDEALTFLSGGPLSDGD